MAEDDPATTIAVLANDENADGGPMTIESATQPANGTVLVATDGLSLTYEPDPGYCNDGSPTDDFTYTLNPGGSSATVAVTVTCVDDAPTLIVITEVVNDNGGTLTPADFTLNVTGNNPAPASFPGEGPPGTAVTLDPGNYSAGIFPRAGYAITSFSPDCAGTIANGESKTCTITADDLPPAVPMCDGKVATIVGQPGQIEIRGTRFDDVIVDLAGDNIVRGRGGDDTICTGDGNDQIIAGDGADTIIDTGGTNTVQAGAGNDSINTADGDDAINAGGGADAVVDAGGQNTVDGGGGNDSVTTTAGDDTINAGAGSDTVDAGEGNNIVNGQGGNDTITTGDGDDTIDGGLGFDTCTPGLGADQITRCEA